MVTRRTFLLGIAGATGASVIAPVSSFAVGTQQSIPTLVARLAPLIRNPYVGQAEPTTLAALRTTVSAIRAEVQASRYDALAYALPATVSTGLATRSCLSGIDAEKADAQLASLFAITSEAMVKFGNRDLANTAAVHSSIFSERSGDVLAMAESAQMRAILARKAGRFADAVTEVVKGADRLGGEGSPLMMSVRGALLNTAGYTAARAGDHEGSRELLDAAAGMAAQLGGDRNWRDTSFGPTNVTIYRIGAATTLGSPDRAISLAMDVPVDTIPHAERRARFWLDVARAFDHWGKPDKCLTALLRAEQSAPVEVRSRENTRMLVNKLLDTSRRVDARALRSFAGRVGLNA